MYKKENGSLLHLKAAGKVLFFLPPLRYYGISFLSLELAEKCAILVVCRYGSSVERQLPKLERRVRLPLSAYFYALVFAGEIAVFLVNTRILFVDVSI